MITAAITFKGAQEPRLRFDRTAVGVVRRLQTALAGSVPEGKTVVVTITAPVRQDSKTSGLLAEKIRELLARRRTQLRATIHGNRIEVRVLKGGMTRTAKLIGFVHNPVPGPAALFDVTQRVLERMGTGKRRLTQQRSLVIENPEGRAPLGTIRQVCKALRARTVFKRILLSDREGVRSLWLLPHRRPRTRVGARGPFRGRA